jgi:hypothetical protein
MRLAAIAAAAALCTVGTASAQQAQPARDAAPPAKEGGRVVFVCDTSAEVWRSWIREHGELSFVSANELVRAQAEKKTWTSPRCITEAELERYETLSDSPRLTKSRAD